MNKRQCHVKSHPEQVSSIENSLESVVSTGDKISFERILLVKPKGRTGLGFSADVIPIGLEYIAASIQDIVEDVQIIDMEFKKQRLQYWLDLFHPDLVGISMSATEHDEGLRLARIAKGNGISTVLGGYHPTAIPDELLSHPQVDIVVRGEGEFTMKELVKKGITEDVYGISYKNRGKIIHNPDRPLIEDLDSLPFPARYLRRHEYRNHLEKNDRELDTITMSRGCLGRCSFCCEPMMSKNRQRSRSPENIMRELLDIVSFHKGRSLKILVTDPNFMGNPEMIDGLCDLLQEHESDIRFSIMARVDSITKHPELVRKMCNSGILNYELGFESPNQRDLNDVKKGITLEMQEKAVKILRDNNANVSGTFIIGLQGQTEEEIKQFPVYAKKIGLVNCAFGIATPFPGTDFYSTLEKDGLIIERDWNKYDEMHSVFELNPLNGKRLEELESYCMTRFWTLNMLLDGVRVSRMKSGDKISLRDFINEINAKLKFARNAGYELREREIKEHVKAVLNAIVDAETEEKERKIPIHDVIEMSRFLRILGAQTIQITLRCNGQIVSYIIRTTSKSIDCIEIISGEHDNASINVDIDLDRVINSLKGHESFNLTSYIPLINQIRDIKGKLNALRLCIALTTDLGYSFVEDRLT